jgi:arginyl-tRNA--protein-N-Asp/Glu arginylyltransferase
MYLRWKQQIITDFSEKNINAMYNRGFVFTRVGKGVMDQTRSLRIDLTKFEMSSENRRILRKTEYLDLSLEHLPLADYHWSIGKKAKDFYDTKFGEGTFSANKVKELLTANESNFNRLFVYSSPYQGELEGVDRSNKESVNKKSSDISPKDPSQPPLIGEENRTIGYCIARETDELIHYSYPFYELRTLNFELKNIGMGMMLRAIIHAKEHGKKYIYLGSFQRPTDIYKLQFAGLEWFDGESWSGDLERLKKEL